MEQSIVWRGGGPPKGKQKRRLLRGGERVPRSPMERDFFSRVLNCISFRFFSDENRKETKKDEKRR